MLLYFSHQGSGGKHLNSFLFSRLCSLTAWWNSHCHSTPFFPFHQPWVDLDLGVPLGRILIALTPCPQIARSITSTHKERLLSLSWKWLSLCFLLLILGKCSHFVHSIFSLASLFFMLEFSRILFHRQLQCLAYYKNSRQIG